MKYLVLMCLLFSKTAVAQNLNDMSAERQQILELYGEEAAADFDRTVKEGLAKVNSILYQELADFICLAPNRLQTLYPNYNYEQILTKKNQSVQDIEYTMNEVSVMTRRLSSGERIDDIALIQATLHADRLKGVDDTISSTILNPALSLQDPRKALRCVPYMERLHRGVLFHLNLKTINTNFARSLSAYQK